MHEVLVNRLGGLSLPRKSVVRLTDRPDMTLDVYVDVKQQYNQSIILLNRCCDPSLEPSRQDGSNNGSQNLFLWKHMANYP